MHWNQIYLSFKLVDAWYSKQSPFYDENSLGIILQKVIENIIISIFIFLFTNMQGHSGLQE